MNTLNKIYLFVVCCHHSGFWVCSAKFWIIAFNEAVEIINKYGIEGDAYADDCSAVLGGKKLDVVIKTLNKMLDELITWSNGCGLTFNPDKTVVVRLGRQHK